MSIARTEVTLNNIVSRQSFVGKLYSRNKGEMVGLANKMNDDSEWDKIKDPM
jgi:hypothetical protein